MMSKNSAFVPEHIREIHRIREQISAEFDHDIRKLAEHLKKAEKNRRNLVRKVPTRK
jgi:hypothetical protein